MQPFISTDASLAPKDRYLQILKFSFDTEGYEFKKSKNAFVQQFELGQRSITASFISTAGMIHSVQFFMYITFADVEKIFKKAVPGYGWKNWTISYNLGMTNNWLCDKNTSKYTDDTLNEAANEFFEKIKPGYDDIIARFTNYNYLEQQINLEPSRKFDYCGRTDKRVINGLILRKYLRKDLSYTEIKQQYLNTFKQDWDCDEQDISTAIDYIESHEHAL